MSTPFVFRSLDIRSNFTAEQPPCKFHVAIRSSLSCFRLRCIFFRCLFRLLKRLERSLRLRPFLSFFGLGFRCLCRFLLCQVPYRVG